MNGQQEGSSWGAHWDAGLVALLVQLEGRYHPFHQYSHCGCGCRAWGWAHQFLHVLYYHYHLVKRSCLIAEVLEPVSSGSLCGSGHGTLVTLPHSPHPNLSESKLDMIRAWLPGQVKDPFRVSFFNGKVHKAEGRLKVSISGRKGGHQNPRLHIFRKTYRSNLERWRCLVNTTSTVLTLSTALCQLTWEVMNSGAWLLTSVIVTATSHVLLRPDAGEGLLVRSQ